MYRHTICMCMWYEAWEVPSGGYGYEQGCRGRVFRHVWQSCEKRRDGKRLQQTTVQSKPDLPNTTARLSVYCDRAWQCGRMCMRVILKLHRHIFRIMLHYSTVCAAPAQIT